MEFLAFFYHVSTKKWSGRNLAKSQYPERRFVRKMTFELGRPWGTCEMSGISLILGVAFKSYLCMLLCMFIFSKNKWRIPSKSTRWNRLTRKGTAVKLKHGLIETPVFLGRGLKCSGSR